MSRTISVALGRFHETVARALRGVLSDDDGLRLVGAGVGLGDLVQLAGRQPLDVVVIDFDALPSARELGVLGARLGKARLVVLTDSPTPAECRRALTFGASACLGKATSARDVLHAVHLAARGLQMVSDGAPALPADDALTAEETSVLELLRAGRSNTETAQLLDMDVSTVRRHARHISHKLTVGERRGPPGA